MGGCDAGGLCTLLGSNLRGVIGGGGRQIGQVETRGNEFLRGSAASRGRVDSGK